MGKHNKMGKKFLNKNVGCIVKTTCTCNTEQVNETQSVIWEGKYWKDFQILSIIIYKKAATFDLEVEYNSFLKIVKIVWKLITRIKETDSLHDVKVKIMDIIAFTKYILINKEISLDRYYSKYLQESIPEFIYNEKDTSSPSTTVFFKIDANAMNSISANISVIFKNIEAIMEEPLLQFRRKSNNFSHSSKNHLRKDSSSKIKEKTIINITPRISDMIVMQIDKKQKDDNKFKAHNTKCNIKKITFREYTDNIKNNTLDYIINIVRDIIQEINISVQACDLINDYNKHTSMNKIRLKMQNIEENFITCMVEDKILCNKFKNLMEATEIETKESKKTVNMVQFFKEDNLKNINNNTIKKLSKPTETNFRNFLITFETMWTIIINYTETEEHKDIYAILESIIKLIKYESKGLNKKFVKRQKHSNNEDCSVDIKDIEVKIFNKLDEKEKMINTLRYEVFWRLIEIKSELREIHMTKMVKRNEAKHVCMSAATEKIDYTFAVQYIEDKKHKERQENYIKNKDWFIVNMDEYNSFFTDTMLFTVRSEEVKKIIIIEKIKYIQEIFNQMKEHNPEDIEFIAFDIDFSEENSVRERERESDDKFFYQIIARSVKHICELIQEIIEFKSINKIENIELPKDAKNNKLTNPDKTSKQDPTMNIKPTTEIFEEMREFVEEMKKMVKTSKEDQEFRELDVPINVDSKLDNLLKKHFVNPIDTKFALNICHDIKESLSEIKEIIEM